MVMLRVVGLGDHGDVEDGVGGDHGDDEDGVGGDHGDDDDDVVLRRCKSQLFHSSIEAVEFSFCLFSSLCYCWSIISLMVSYRHVS